MKATDNCSGQHPGASVVSYYRKITTLLANRHQFNLLSLGPSRESRAGTREAGRRAERGISLPLAGAPTLPSESDVENDVTFGGRVSCDETVVAISEKCQKSCSHIQSACTYSGIEHENTPGYLDLPK